MYIVYNCGYHSVISLDGPVTKKKYSFKRRFVTEVNDEDALKFLEMTHQDIPWCPTNSKTIPPFMKLEDWCTGKQSRFDCKPIKVYSPEEYRSLFLLK